VACPIRDFDHCVQSSQPLDGAPQVCVGTLQLGVEGPQRPWRAVNESKAKAAALERLEESDDEPEIAAAPSFEKGRGGKKPAAPKLFFSVQTVLQTRGTVPKPSRFKTGAADAHPQQAETEFAFAQTKGWPQIVAEFEEEKRKEVALVKLDTARLQTELVELRGVISVLEDDKLAMRRRANEPSKKHAATPPAEPQESRAREAAPPLRRDDAEPLAQTSLREVEAPSSTAISVAVAANDPRSKLDSGASSRGDSRHSARSVMTPATSTRPGPLAQPSQPLSTKLESHLASQLGTPALIL
jgi:hypothetical protein